jgi:hypothetical protein
MAGNEIKIDDLPEIDEVTGSTLFPVDTGTETFAASASKIFDFVKGYGLVNIYSPTVSYSATDFAFYNGDLYKSLDDDNVGNTPSSSPTKWVRAFGARHSVSSAITSATTLSHSIEDVVLLNPSSAIDVKLDNTFQAGRTIRFVNISSIAEVTLKANDDTVIATVYRDTCYECICAAAAPGTTTDWHGLTTINSPWITYTPTVTASTTNPTVNSSTGYWKRAGTDIIIKIRTTLTGGSGDFRWSMPESLSPNTSLMVETAANYYAGHLAGFTLDNSASNSTTTRYILTGVWNTSSSRLMAFANGVSPIGSTLFSWATADRITFGFQAPIIGWSTTKG